MLALVKREVEVGGESHISQKGRGGSPHFQSPTSHPGPCKPAQFCSLPGRMRGILALLTSHPSLQDCPPPSFSSSQRLVGPQCRASRLESAAAENPGVQVMAGSLMGAGGGMVGKRPWLWEPGGSWGRGRRRWAAGAALGSAACAWRGMWGAGILHGTPW